MVSEGQPDLLTIVGSSVFSARSLVCPAVLLSFISQGHTKSLTTTSGIDSTALILSAAFGEKIARRTHGVASAGPFPVAESRQIPSALKVLACELRGMNSLDRVGMLGLGLLMIHPLTDGNGRLGRLAWCRGLLELGMAPEEIARGFRLFQSESGFPAWQTYRAAALGNDKPFLLRWRSAFAAR
jgi:hypothetical protein